LETFVGFNLKVGSYLFWQNVFPPEMAIFDMMANFAILARIKNHEIPPFCLKNASFRT
jgi:hypothetical protein